jgi:hypothetical protein
MCLYCREGLTDGWVPAAEVPILAFPHDMQTAEHLAQLLLTARLITVDAKRNAPRYHVSAYVPRNGTRDDAMHRSDQRRYAARTRWAMHPVSKSHSEVHSEVQSTTDASAVRDASPESKTESEESSAGVGDPRAPAPPRTRDDDRSNRIENRDDDDLDGRIVIMLAAHGFSVNREQARGVRLRIVGGRRIDNVARYVSAALATADGARKWAPSPAVMPPRGLDPVTAARAAKLRAAANGQDTLDDADAADTAHRGADAARKMLNDRPRTEAPAAAAPPRQLHGADLAAAQLAESRASRAMPVPVDDDDDDQDQDDDEYRTNIDYDDDEELPRETEDIELPDEEDAPPF